MEVSGQHHAVLTLTLEDTPWKCTHFKEAVWALEIAISKLKRNIKCCSICAKHIVLFWLLLYVFL